MSEHEKAQKVAMRTDELARLRAENERIKLELEISWDDLPGAIDALDDVIPQGCKQLLRQCAKDLRALRRPVEQSYAQDVRQYVSTKTLHEPCHSHFDVLLSVLDATARQLRERVEMLSVVQDALSERNRECVELRERCGRLEGALQSYVISDDYRDPPERHREHDPFDPLYIRFRNASTALTASQQHTAGSGDGVAGD